MDEIKIFSPATVANVACGFDVLGFCLDTVGDEMVVRKTATKGISITKIEGYDLPMETKRNVAGVAALALLEKVEVDFGFEIEIYKNIKPGSGVGSSSASASGVVFAMNELLGRPFNKTQLSFFAMKGEAVASGSEHADNIAPGIFGGFTLVKSTNPLEILELPTPHDMYATIVHPQIEIKTSEARAILPKEIVLQNAITQWANVGSLVHGLHISDYDLISSALKDVVVEPFRKQLIPYFDNAKKAALEAGALGVGISGSGPSIFSLNKGEETAHKVAEAFKNVYDQTGIEFNLYVSRINPNGIKIL
ncbi:homoserine kinase [Mangrovimonas sp. AS39]|uniref:homoserine kinase n=1 Tax=Mangrovimonas futianensis TaxID=2895523 RepID=UPI001E302824|nr:homoserine kinase [Mangrovimonas futianensis]MCF1191839.1 homoserine kinase [Mangrovimonas futianensis]MCF1195273.1 homoserine kinase [Mangrovimonas futianensis]